MLYEPEIPSVRSHIITFIFHKNRPNRFKANPSPATSKIVLHRGANREYAHGQAKGLPGTKVGTFIQALYDEAALMMFLFLIFGNLLH